MSIEEIKHILLMFSVLFLSITIIAMLIRAYLGPRTTDTLLAINVINVKTLVLIGLLAFLFHQDYLLDVALIYGILGFLSVVVFSQIILSQASSSKTKTEDEVREVKR